MHPSGVDAGSCTSHAICCHRVYCRAATAAPASPAPTPAVDVCSLEKVVGPCRAAMPRWWFNADSSRCEQFTYGGCGGNANNFRSEQACVAGADACLSGTPWKGCRAPRSTPRPSSHSCNSRGWCKQVRSPAECAALKAGNCDGADCAGAIYLANSDRCRLCASVRKVRDVAAESKYALAAAKGGAPTGAVSGGAIAGVVGAVIAVAAAAAACVVASRRRAAGQQQQQEVDRAGYSELAKEKNDVAEQEDIDV